MKIRVANCVNLRYSSSSSAVRISSVFRRLISNAKHNERSSHYDEKRDYKTEVPGLQYGTQVMSFGDGSNGALGDHGGGVFSDIFSPEPVQGLPKNIKRVAAGHYHSLAVTDDGEVWAWGRNSEGQLGRGDGTPRTDWGKPKKVTGLENVQVMDVAGSGVVSMALASDGSLWSWGSSKRGQLGLSPDLIRATVPQQLTAFAGQQVSQMALGWGHALACTTGGELYAWGYAADGRLGFNAEQEDVTVNSNLHSSDLGQSLTTLSWSERAEAVDDQIQDMLKREGMVAPVWEPLQVEALADQRVKNVACGMDHSLALSEEGKLYSFGDNSLGQLGRPISKAEVVGAVHFPDGIDKVISVAAGLGHSLAVALNSQIEELPVQPPEGLTNNTEVEEAAKGYLFSWGWNSGSQLGRAGQSSLPGLVEGLTEARLVQLSGGRVHSAGMSSKRQIWIWGSGRNGRLGLDSSVDEPYPFPMERFGFWKTLQVACGFDHSLLLIRTVEH